MGLCRPVVIVEHHHRQHHAARHHHHDAVEVGAWEIEIWDISKVWKGGVKFWVYLLEELRRRCLALSAKLCLGTRSMREEQSHLKQIDNVLEKLKIFLKMYSWIFAITHQSHFKPYPVWVSPPSQVEEWIQGEPWRRWARKGQSGWRSSTGFDAWRIVGNFGTKFYLNSFQRRSDKG